MHPGGAIVRLHAPFSAGVAFRVGHVLEGGLQNASIVDGSLDHVLDLVIVAMASTPCPHAQVPNGWVRRVAHTTFPVPSEFTVYPQAVL